MTHMLTRFGAAPIDQLALPQQEIIFVGWAPITRTLPSMCDSRCRRNRSETEYLPPIHRTLDTKNTYMKKLLLVGIITATALLSGCGTPSRSTTFKPVEPGFLFKGNYINVHAPMSPGWHLLAKASSGMEFARSGKESVDSFGAQVLMFQMPPTQGKDEFLSHIKSGMKKDTDPDRFRIITSEFTYSDKRAYPCVDASVVVEDKAPQTTPAARAPLLLQSKALYCRHPVYRETGFGIIYSYRGPKMYATLDSEAKAFIEGVQVPDK
jgi:hypothetical protein